MDNGMDTGNRARWNGTANADSGNISGGLIIAFAIMAIGVLFLLDNFGFPVGVVWSYWPVIFVAIGLAKLVDSPNSAGRTGGAIFMLVGVVLLADKIHVPFLNNVSLWALWPLGLIAFGMMMLWGALEGKNPNLRLRFAGGGDRDTVSMLSVFGGSNRQVSGEFKGAELVAIFGGGGLDLRNATMVGDEAIVNVTAIFGGFEIKAPETWLVQVRVVGVFGGHEDKTRQPDRLLVPQPKRLVIQGATIFGGLGVKN
jgi:predicted membrane protein